MQGLVQSVFTYIPAVDRHTLPIEATNYDRKEYDHERVFWNYGFQLYTSPPDTIRKQLISLPISILPSARDHSKIGCDASLAKEISRQVNSAANSKGIMWQARPTCEGEG